MNNHGLRIGIPKGSGKSGQGERKKKSVGGIHVAITFFRDLGSEEQRKRGGGERGGGEGKGKEKRRQDFWRSSPPFCFHPVPKGEEEEKEEGKRRATGNGIEERQNPASFVRCLH